MRLVAVSIVKNEADIIEAFVRHTLAWVDHLLVFDHDSTDGTRQILFALQSEGLRVSLYTDTALGNLQQARSNHLTRVAAEQFQADWVLPLDADEILVAPNRPALEQYLNSADAQQPSSLPLLNYYPAVSDQPDEANPVLRLRYCQRSFSSSRKVIIPRGLALDPAVTAGKGSHALYRQGSPIQDRPLPDVIHLAHLALRSPQHHALRVVLAELQKLSRGQAHAGLDVHYRLGFQLLAEDPEKFFASIYPPIDSLRHQPISYRGQALRHAGGALGWYRIGRALLPYLEKLAVSHGRLQDSIGPETATEAEIRELHPDSVASLPRSAGSAAFCGFSPIAGWGEAEGPVPEAFLPQFHWGYAPATRLAVPAEEAGTHYLCAEVLTYSEDQVIEVEVDGVIHARHTFTRINQQEKLQVRLPLRAGNQEITLRYAKALVTTYDPRQLAVIFLRLQVSPAPPASP